MRALLAFLVLLMGLAVPLTPVEASDPLRLRENFDVLELHPYLSATKGDGVVFSIQNAGSVDLNLLISRPAPLELLTAFMPDLQNRTPLRLFSSDDSEFVTKPGLGDELRFFVPAGKVQSFYLMGGGENPVLYLWSPEGRSEYQTRRQTFHSAILLMLGIGLALGIFSAAYRRSRRAVYALVMGGGLMVLLASLWMHDVLPQQDMFADWQANRLSIIRLSFALGVAMVVLAHVNLVIKQIINRNYWTRVIIVTDIWLVAAIGLWIWQAMAPGYAGLVSADLGHVFMAMTCTCVVMGAIFVPDRPRQK